MNKQKFDELFVGILGNTLIRFPARELDEKIDAIFISVW